MSSEEYQALLGEKVGCYIREQQFHTLAARYAENLANGRFLWRYRVGAEAVQDNGAWVVKKAIMSRSARVLMEGWVRIPGDSF